MNPKLDRRRVVQAASGLVVVSGVVAAGAAPANESKRNRSQEVTPPEDLMREHGVLNRVLLIYEAAIKNFARNESFDVSVISEAAEIIREFIEGYHERNEEQQVFPRFRKAGQMVDLVNVLYQQHQAGRRLTDTILGLVPRSFAFVDDQVRLVSGMQSFITMYRPHEAREDTDLFPKLRSVVSPNEFDAMAEDFERDERRKFGQNGFETMIARVANLEKTLGIDDLAGVTPT
jgi:hemerythrin-like domain-containing protein